MKLLIDAADRRRLDALARYYAINTSAVLRMLVKREADDVRARQRARRVAAVAAVAR